MLPLLTVLLLAAPNPSEQVLRAVFTTGAVHLAAPVESYTGEQIYDYMDGAGELPRACGYRSLAVGLLTDGRRKLTVELFASGRDAEAFGIYSLRRQPGEEIVVLTHRARHVAGELAGWRGSYTWVLSSAAEPVHRRDELRALAQRLEAALPAAGDLPDLLRHLPRAGLLADSARFFHGKFALDTVWFRPANLLGLPLPTDAEPLPVDVVAASYERPAGSLLVARYPTADLATAALARWQAAAEPDERGLVRDCLLGLVVECADPTALLAALRERLANPGEPWPAA
ncbi:MAG: hypothetical protein IT204_02830 [Fimbriimonadaceae bacterium]|nr:hypothetical protein [Fimbriimonadaceae bacterium]